MTRLAMLGLRAFAAVLYYTGLHRLWIWLIPGPRVLLLHACATSESDWIRGLESNTTPDALETLARFVKKYYRVTTIDEIERGSFPRRAVALTFDDGYRSVYDHAFPILRRYDIPATVYIIGGTLEPGRTCWVNRLNRWVHVDPAAAREAVARRWSDLSTREVSTLVWESVLRCGPSDIDGLLGDAPPEGVSDDRIHMTVDEVSALAEAGWSIGNHTFSHFNLECLDPVQAEEELMLGFRAIEGLPGTSRSVAYPFGLHTQTVREIAVRASASSIMEVGGWNFLVDLTRIARIPVLGTTELELFAEIEVIGFFKGVLKRVLG